MPARTEPSSLPVFVAIDFETSGRTRNSACSIGLVRVEDGILTKSYYTLIRPPSSHVLFTWVHGLTWSMLKNARSFSELWPEIRAFMAGAQGLIAHNAPFDRKVLEGCCVDFGCRTLGLPFYCTLKGARACLKLPSLRLDSICEYYGIDLRHHNALSDARAAAEIFVRLQRDEGLPVERMQLAPRAAR